MFIPQKLRKHIIGEEFSAPFNIPTQNLYFNKINQDFLINYLIFKKPTASRQIAAELFRTKRIFKFDNSCFVRDLHNLNVEMFSLVSSALTQEPKDFSDNYYFKGSWDPAAIFKIQNERRNIPYKPASFEIVLDPDVRQPGNVYGGKYPFWQDGGPRWAEKSGFDYEYDRLTYSPKKIWDWFWK